MDATNHCAAMNGLNHICGICRGDYSLAQHAGCGRLFSTFEIAGRPASGADGCLSMELKLYDTLTREKRAFTPLDPARVRMYVCGPTVYDFAHIGNARPVIVFDVLFRLLRHIYGDEHVTYVRNITDVDDKINARAAERGVIDPRADRRDLQNFKADVAALGCLPPTVEPRATEHIDEMKALIERLVEIRPRLCRPKTMCCSTCRRCRITASFPTARSMR